MSATDQATQQTLAEKMLGERTTAVLKEKSWSLRQAQIQTGVNHSVIQKMSKGLSVNPDNAERFARNAGEDPLVWRAMAAGLPVIRIELLEDGTRALIVEDH